MTWYISQHTTCSLLPSPILSSQTSRHHSSIGTEVTSCPRYTDCQQLRDETRADTTYTLVYTIPVVLYTILLYYTILPPSSDVPQGHETAADTLVLDTWDKVPPGPSAAMTAGILVIGTDTTHDLPVSGDPARQVAASVRVHVGSLLTRETAPSAPPDDGDPRNDDCLLAPLVAVVA